MSNKLAEVVAFFENGAAKVKFHGETEPSLKEYPYLKSYIPSVGDNVLMMEVGDSYVILGSINYQVPPADNLSLIETLMNEIESDYLKTTTAEADYIKKSNLYDEIFDNHTKNKGVHLIYSNMTEDVNGNYNIKFMYVDAPTGRLVVVTNNGQWTSYARV